MASCKNEFLCTLLFLVANNVTALQLSGSKKSKESDREHTSEEKKKKQPESKGFRIPKKVCLCGYMYIIYLLSL